MKSMEKTTMSVQELSAQMGISLPKAYELVKSEDFPPIRIGTRILIPVDAFREWLVITSNLLGRYKQIPPLFIAVGFAPAGGNLTVLDAALFLSNHIRVIQLVLTLDLYEINRPSKRMRMGFFPTRASCKLPTNTM